MLADLELWVWEPEKLHSVPNLEPDGFPVRNAY